MQNRENALVDPGDPYLRLVIEVVRQAIKDADGDIRHPNHYAGDRAMILKDTRRVIMSEDFDFWLDALDLDPAVTRRRLLERWEEVA